MVPQIKLMSWLSAMNMYGLVLLYWVFALSEGCLLTVTYYMNENKRCSKEHLSACQRSHFAV